jgi:hypothetical protein
VSVCTRESAKIFDVTAAIQIMMEEIKYLKEIAL